MRFMIIVKASKDSEAGKMPSQELLEAMGKFNEELVKAGIMLSGEGLQASSKGARMRISGNKRTVIDGPSTETIFVNSTALRDARGGAIDLFEYHVKTADGRRLTVYSEYFAYKVGDCVTLLESSKPTYPRIAPADSGTCGKVS